MKHTLALGLVASVFAAGCAQQSVQIRPEPTYQQAAEVMVCNMMCEDAAEGIDAFMAKRKPVWTGK